MLPAALAVGLCLPLLVLAQSGEKDGARRTLYVQRTPLCVEGLEASTRPQTLHQVAWLGEASVLEHENKLRDSWMKHNQGWTHRVWDEGAVSALVKDSYPWFEETYHSLPSNQQRAEVAVYLVLHSFGGVFADTDVECFQKFDSLLEGPVLQIFEEPMDKWEKVDARGNTLSHHLVSGSLMTASQPGHPLLLKVLQKVRPAGEAYAPTNGQLIQKQLRLCQRTDDEGCGCYRTMRSEHFFPPHAALLPATNFSSSVHHVDELRRLVSEINTGKWPPQQASTVRWGLRKIDPGLDRLLVVGMQASLAGDEAGDEMLRAYVSAEWGKKEKYQTESEKRAMDKARKAYEKAARLAPAYAWPHYELGNIELESKRCGTGACPLHSPNCLSMISHRARVAEVRRGADLFSAPCPWPDHSSPFSLVRTGRCPCPRTLCAWASQSPSCACTALPPLSFPGLTRAPILVAQIRRGARPLPQGGPDGAEGDLILEQPGRDRAQPWPAG